MTGLGVTVEMIRLSAKPNRTLRIVVRLTSKYSAMRFCDSRGVLDGRSARCSRTVLKVLLNTVSLFTAMSLVRWRRVAGGIRDWLSATKIIGTGRSVRLRDD